VKLDNRGLRALLELQEPLAQQVQQDHKALRVTKVTRVMLEMLGQQAHRELKARQAHKVLKASKARQDRKGLKVTLD
jgi:hypothetical protein